MPNKKSTRGRRPGQQGKAHNVRAEIEERWRQMPVELKRKPGADGITPEILESWKHGELAGNGNFPPAVQHTAFLLGKLAREYKRVLGDERINLEANLKGVVIPLPLLPKGEKFSDDELQLLQQSGHDVIWAMQHFGWLDGFRILSALIKAAADNDARFFKELWRRVESGVPLEGPVEPDYSALSTLKSEYRKSAGPILIEFLEKRAPSLRQLFKLPPRKRRPLTIAQIGDWVRAFDGTGLSDRALSAKAKQLGIPVARPGRRSNRELK